MTIKTLCIIVCVTVLLFSEFWHSFALGQELDEIQIVNDSGDELRFEYTTGSSGWEEFEIDADDIWTLYCQQNAEMRIRIDGRRVRYDLRCGNTYELYWNSNRGRIGVARVRD